MSQDTQKQAAAEAAVKLVHDGMVVGLGTGSTAAFAIDALGDRVQDGLEIIGIPTSERSAEQAKRRGIPLSDLSRHPHVALTIDGADEITRSSLHLIKGLGGALLREKIVATASDRLVIIADGSKLVDRLGGTVPLPVEVVAFGWETTAERIRRLGCEPRLHQGADGKPYRTDGGNLILRCRFGLIDDPAALETELSRIVGVVETGLFIGMANTALVATEDGVRALSV